MYVLNIFEKFMTVYHCLMGHIFCNLEHEQRNTYSQINFMSCFSFNDYFCMSPI